MKVSKQLHLSSRARAVRRALLVGMVVVWGVVVFGLLPRDREISSAPGGERTSPALPYSIPASPVNV
jgi:hypothetical protein